MQSILTVSKFLPVKQNSQGVKVASRVVLPLKGEATKALTKHVAHKARGRTWAGFIAITLIAGNVLLLGIHIVNANAYAVKGYEISSIRNRISGLTEDRKKLNLQLAEGASIVEAQQSVLNDGWVAVTSVEFLRPAALHVSKR